MVGWIILGVIVLILVGINLIRIGVDVSYEGGEFSLSAKVAGVLLQLLPKQDKDEEKPKKEKKPRKKKKKKDKKEEESGETSDKPKKKGLPLGMTKEELFDLVKAILHHFARFPRRFRIDRFKLHALIAGQDPYNTAMAYGYLNEALSILLPLARQGFTVKKSDVRTDVDFTTDQFALDFGMGLSIRIGQIVGFLLQVVFIGARHVLKSKLRQKKEAKAAAKSASAVQKQDSEHIENTENDKDITPEERMDSHG